MSTQPAIKTTEGGTATVVHDAPLPVLQDEYVLVETRALSLNPTDWKHMKYLSYPGTTLGCDWSGVVLETGKAVTKFKPGDEVFGIVHGGHNTNHHSGAFARVITSRESATWHKPPALSFEQASTLGVALITIGQSLYFTGDLPLPSAGNLSNPPTQDILIYGGSSGTGTVAIQFARLSGLKVHATSSPANFPLLESRGAHSVHDYSSPTSAEEIKSLTGDDVTVVLDCIGAAAYCAAALSARGGWYHTIVLSSLAEFQALRPEEGVRATTALGYDFVADGGYRWKNGMEFAFKPEQKTYAYRWWGVVDGLLERGLIVPHPMEVREGGLEGVLEGMREMMETGGPRGKKMVYPVRWDG